MGERFTKDELFEMLHALDDRLDETGWKGTFHIDAIGGFAMLCHGLRHDAPYTGDIDTMTPGFPKAVKRALYDISKERGVSNHWLNNDCVFSFGDEPTQDDVDFVNFQMDAAYEPVSESFKHIDMRVADLQTTTRGKMQAMCDNIYGRTSRDVDDVLELFEYQEIHTLEEAHKAYPCLDEDPALADFDEVYATCVRYGSEPDIAQRLQSIGNRHMGVEAFDGIQFDTDYDFV